MNETPSPEFAFVAACCNWPRTPARRMAICQAAGDVRDWDFCLRLVAFHRVFGLVAEGVASAAAAVPDFFAERLTKRRGSIARNSLLQAMESARLQQECDAADIPALILKGAAMEMLAYGTLGIKQSRDIDLYVPPSRVDAALALAARLGYDLSPPYAGSSSVRRRFFERHFREYGLTRRDGKMELEISWCLNDTPNQTQEFIDLSCGQMVALSNALSVRTLKNDDLFCYLCQHGARHRWFRLKWLADLNAWLSRFDAAALCRMYAQARVRGCGYSAGQALLLCRRIFALPLPEEHFGALYKSRRLRWLQDSACRAMRYSGKTCREPGSSSLSPHLFLLCASPRDVWRHVRRAALQPNDVFCFPLPPRLYFLYWILRAPLFLLRRLGWGRKMG